MFWVGPKPKLVFQQVAQSKPCHFTGIQISFVKSEMAGRDDPMFPPRSILFLSLVQDFLQWCSDDYSVTFSSQYCPMTQSHWTSHIWAPASLCPWLAVFASWEKADILVPWPTRFPSKNQAFPSVMKLRESIGLAWRQDKDSEGRISSAYYDALQPKTWLPVLMR